MFTHIRRNSLKVIAASAMALFPIGKPRSRSQRNLGPREALPCGSTAADKRYALADPLRWHRASGKVGTNSIVILPARKQQPVLGFGAALTDAACYMINEMPEAERDKLLHELFRPKTNGFQRVPPCDWIERLRQNHVQLRRRRSRSSTLAFLD